MFITELAQHLRCNECDLRKRADKIGFLRTVHLPMGVQSWVSEQGARRLIAWMRQRQGVEWETGKRYPSLYR